MPEPISHRLLAGDRGAPIAGHQELERSLDECWGRLSTLHQKVGGSTRSRPVSPQRLPARQHDQGNLDAALTAVGSAAHLLLRHLEGPVGGFGATGLVDDDPRSSVTATRPSGA